MEMGYWNRALGRPLSRRKALAATGGAAAAAALLAACGSGGSKASSGGGGAAAKSTGIAVAVKDETASLVRGGIYKSVLGTPPTLDPHFTGPQTTHCWMC